MSSSGPDHFRIEIESDMTFKKFYGGWWWCEAIIVSSPGPDHFRIEIESDMTFKKFHGGGM